MKDILNYFANDLMSYLCPHCHSQGSWYEYKYDNGHVIVARVCNECDYHTGYYSDESLATDEWNSVWGE